MGPLAHKSHSRDTLAGLTSRAAPPSRLVSLCFPVHHSAMLASYYVSYHPLFLSRLIPACLATSPVPLVCPMPPPFLSAPAPRRTTSRPPQTHPELHIYRRILLRHASSRGSYSLHEYLRVSSLPLPPHSSGDGSPTASATAPPLPPVSSRSRASLPLTTLPCVLPCILPPLHGLVVSVSLLPCAPVRPRPTPPDRHRCLHHALPSSVAAIPRHPLLPSTSAPLPLHHTCMSSPPILVFPRLMCLRLPCALPRRPGRPARRPPTTP